MSALTFHWFLPTTRDSRHVVVGGHGSTAGTAGGDRPASIEYLGQIARAAEQLGFVGALTPTGAWCEDAWLTTAMLTQVTERLKFLVAFRPGQISPTLSAQMAATYQRQSHGRLLLNVVTGGESAEQRAYGDFLDKDQRYARTGEFLDIVRRLWAGGTADHRGEHLRIEGPVLNRLPDPAPQIYFGGSSPAAGEVAAGHTDVYLTWGEPPQQVKQKIDRVRSLAVAQGRDVRFGTRLHTITRDTSAQAWAEAERLLAAMDPERVKAMQEGLATSESEGRRRMRELHNSGDTGNLEICPNLWAGVAWCAAVRARPWWAVTRRSRTSSRSTTGSGSRSSSSPACRTWRRRTGSVRVSCRCWRSAVCGGTRPVRAPSKSSALVGAGAEGARS